MNVCYAHEEAGRKKSIRRFFVVTIAARCAGAALAQEAQAPAVEGFRLDGEQWTCTADGKALSGLLLKPEGAGPFPAIILATAWAATRRR